MENINEIKIDVPEGMEAYIENNIIKFKSIKKKLNYKDIAKKLFYNKEVYYLYPSVANESNNIISVRMANIDFICDLVNCTSKKQAQKLLAINQLMNVAKYLNEGWQPDWTNSNEKKYFIYCYPIARKLDIKTATIHMSDIVYFKSVELAQQAIDILKEDTIILALSTNW